ncbi:hypothetical protein BKE79_25120 [Salmonella enterica]|nr:hypothetical protein [Salmonella enterica]ECH7874546.1 hypothetical protein [Salmonella enterica subsp. enterica serovar Rubislaw]
MAKKIMTNTLKNLIKHYSLWWQSNADYTLSPGTKDFVFSIVIRRIRNGILLSLALLPAAGVMLRPMYGSSVGYAAVMMAISACALGDRLFFKIMKRTINNSSKFCYQYPFITTALYYFTCHCVLSALIIYVAILNYIMSPLC